MELLRVPKIHSTLIKNFSLYGELINKKNAYDYEEEGLYGKFLLFGIILEGVNADAISEIIVRLGLKNFAFDFSNDSLEAKKVT